MRSEHPQRVIETSQSVLRGFFKVINHEQIEHTFALLQIQPEQVNGGRQDGCIRRVRAPSERHTIIECPHESGAISHRNIHCVPSMFDSSKVKVLLTT
jgi:hypothetical protein